MVFHFCGKRGRFRNIFILRKNIFSVVSREGREGGEEGKGWEAENREPRKICEQESQRNNSIQPQMNADKRRWKGPNAITKRCGVVTNELETFLTAFSLGWGEEKTQNIALFRCVCAVSAGRAGAFKLVNLAGYVVVIPFAVRDCTIPTRTNLAGMGHQMDERPPSPRPSPPRRGGTVCRVWAIRKVRFASRVRGSPPDGGAALFSRLGKVRGFFRGAGCPPSTAGGTPAATLPLQRPKKRCRAALATAVQDIAEIRAARVGREASCAVPTTRQKSRSGRRRRQEALKFRGKQGEVRVSSRRLLQFKRVAGPLALFETQGRALQYLIMFESDHPGGTADAGMSSRHVLCNMSSSKCEIDFSRPSGTRICVPAGAKKWDATRRGTAGWLQFDKLPIGLPSYLHVKRNDAHDDHESI